MKFPAYLSVSIFGESTGGVHEMIQSNTLKWWHHLKLAIINCEFLVKPEHIAGDVDMRDKEWLYVQKLTNLTDMNELF